MLRAANMKLLDRFAKYAEFLHEILLNIYGYHILKVRVGPLLVDSNDVVVVVDETSAFWFLLLTFHTCLK